MSPADPDPGAQIGLVLAKARRTRGMSLAALAEACGCARSYLSEIERGLRAPPSEGLLERLEEALGLSPHLLVEAARWGRLPSSVREEVTRLRADGEAARRLATLLRGTGDESEARTLPGGPEPAMPGRSLDQAWRTGELQRLIDRISPPTGADSPEAGAPGSGSASGTVPGCAAGAGPDGPSGLGGQGADHPLIPTLPSNPQVPLINRVAAGYPTEFTDLGYPARVADEYVRVPGLQDPDAFGARVVGDSMEPEYREGDVVVFSPARPVRDACDCFARLEPDHETTFKRVYFQQTEDGRELIRLQPLNSAYPPRVLEREQVAGLYAAVSVTRTV